MSGTGLIELNRINQCSQSFKCIIFTTDILHSSIEMKNISLEAKQLPSPPPEVSSSKYGTLQQAKSSTTSNRLASSSSTVSTGQAKRTEYGSGTINGGRRADINDDLLIRLLAQEAVMDSHESHILAPEEIEELRNVCGLCILILTSGTTFIKGNVGFYKSKADIGTKGQASCPILEPPRNHSK